MTEVSRPRSLLATLIGWIVVGIVAWFLLGWLIGTILWVLRTVLIILVIGGLITLYFKLKTPND